MKCFKKYLLNLFLFFICITIYTSCAQFYVTYMFTYPPGSKPHENNWAYIGEVWFSPVGKKPYPSYSKKHVAIFVEDKEKNNYLKDKFDVEGADLLAKATWDVFEQLTIVIYEERYEDTGGEFNKNHLRKEPRDILILRYQFDDKTKKFKRIEYKKLG